MKLTQTSITVEEIDFDQAVEKDPMRTRSCNCIVANAIERATKKKVAMIGIMSAAELLPKWDDEYGVYRDFIQWDSLQTLTLISMYDTHASKGEIMKLLPLTFVANLLDYEESRV